MIIIRFLSPNDDRYIHYTEHCSVGPTKLIETTTTIASMRMKNDEDFYG